MDSQTAHSWKTVADFAVEGSGSHHMAPELCCRNVKEMTMIQQVADGQMSVSIHLICCCLLEWILTGYDLKTA